MAAGWRSGSNGLSIGFWLLAFGFRLLSDRFGIVITDIPFWFSI